MWSFPSIARGRSPPIWAKSDNAFAIWVDGVSLGEQLKTCRSREAETLKGFPERLVGDMVDQAFSQLSLR